MNNLKLSDLETVLQQNDGFVLTNLTQGAISYVHVAIYGGGPDLHYFFNYGSLIYKGNFAPDNIGFFALGNLLCQFHFYFTEMHALQGRKEVEKVWRYYECWGGFQALDFALTQLGMSYEAMNEWKLLLKR